MREEKCIAENITGYRKTYEMTQEEFAEGCNISVDTVSNLEREIANPSLKMLQRIAKFMGIDMVQLCSRRTEIEQ